MRWRNLTPTDALAGLTAAEREGLTGYVQTLQAYDLLRIINTRDENGAPVDVDIDPTGAAGADRHEGGGVHPDHEPARTRR